MTDTPYIQHQPTAASSNVLDSKNQESVRLIGNIIASTTDDAESARMTAIDLLRRFGGLRGVLDAEHHELSSAEGVTEEAAMLLRLVRALAKGYFKGLLEGRDMIGSSAMLTEYLRLLLSGERTNAVFAVYLDDRNRFIETDRLDGEGSSGMVQCSGALIERALSHKARAAIIAINHPNGDEAPTDKDTSLIEALDRAAISSGLIIHDHIIIGNSNHFSSLKNGWIFGTPSHFLVRTARNARRAR